jgi:hypothetical protein
MAEPDKQQIKLFYDAFFLDLLTDRRTRPFFIYVLIIIMLGVMIFHWLEGWTWIDSFYFVVITLTTIGYGDFSPTTPLTKLITIFYGVNGVILLLMLFDVIRRFRHWELPDSGDS